MIEFRVNCPISAELDEYIRTVVVHLQNHLECFFKENTHALALTHILILESLGQMERETNISYFFQLPYNSNVQQGLRIIEYKEKIQCSWCNSRNVATYQNVFVSCSMWKCFQVAKVISNETNNVGCVCSFSLSLSWTLYFVCMCVCLQAGGID